jgi:hypothetical protein
MTWDDVWSVLQQEFARLAADVTGHTADVVVQSGQGANEAFPFGCYLSFRRATAEDEDVVLSLDCWNKNDTVECRCDVARGDGYVLVDGPTAIITQSELQSSSALWQWVGDVSQFVQLQARLVSDELLLAMKRQELE